MASLQRLMRPVVVASSATTRARKVASLTAGWPIWRNGWRVPEGLPFGERDAAAVGFDVHADTRQARVLCIDAARVRRGRITRLAPVIVAARVVHHALVMRCVRRAARVQHGST